MLVKTIYNFFLNIFNRTILTWQADSYRPLLTPLKDTLVSRK